MRRWVVALAVGLLATLVADLAAQPPSYDLLLRGGRVLDGSGNPWVRQDVAIRGGRIAAVGDLSRESAAAVLDLEGLYLAPGFIDVHSHAGPGLESRQLSGAAPLLTQGITTVLINPDGGGPWDLESQRKRLQRHGLGVNVALLVPHGSIRRRVLGMNNRAPTEEELDEMKALVKAGMEEGAFGLSSGLFYAPGSFAKTEEIVELARVAAAWGGVYTSHIRDEADYSVGVVAAVQEVIQVAAEAGLPGVVTHIKALGPRVWGASAQLVQRIQQARDRGLEVFADQYPYLASATGLTAALVPREAEAGGREAVVAHLSRAEPELLAAMAENLERRGGAGRIGIRSFPPDPELEGMRLSEIASLWGLEPVEAARRMLLKSPVSIVSYNMIAEDVERLMVQSWVMTCSDGGLVSPGQGIPHPRGYGTFPRKIRRYVLEHRILRLGDAVRSMSSLPATVFEIPDRGWIRPGQIADLVVLDLDRLQDHATFQQPHQFSEGVVHLLINGRFAIRDEHLTQAKAGRVLRKKPPGREPH